MMPDGKFEDVAMAEENRDILQVRPRSCTDRWKDHRGHKRARRIDDYGRTYSSRENRR